MTSTNSFLHSESFSFRKGTMEKSRCVGRQRLMAPLRSEIEPEHRLYKLSREAASPKFGTLELIAFLFFGALAIAATVSSFSELFHLLVSGSVDHVVQALLPR